MIPKRRSARWPWVLALVVVLGGGFGGWRWYQARAKDTALDFKTASITRGDLIQSVTANGQISPVKNVTVGSQVSGIITDIKVDFNSRVTNGQVVAQIDPSTYQQNITQSDADLANAVAGQELAEMNWRRAKELREASLIPVADFDKAVADLHQAQAVVKMRAAALQKSKVDLERTTIYSPIDGVVISRVVDIGQTVAASFNAPTLFTIANDLHNMRIEAMVSEADVGGVEEQQAVTFTVDAFPNRKFRGKVSQVRFAAITNQNVVTYTAVIDVNNDDLKLRPGMTANASIITAQRRDVLRIPNAALRFRPPEDAVVKGETNAPAARTGGTNGMVVADGSGPPRGEGGERPNREEMRKRFESMTPEQREQMRARFAASGGGGRGMGGGPGGGAMSSSDGPGTRTVFMLEGSSGPATEKVTGKAPGMAGLIAGLGSTGKEKPVLKQVTIKTGISDGAFTEVLEGLKDGDVIVTGVNLAATGTATAAGTRPPTTPFGGPFGGGMRPR